jgi:hypothetical protein
MLIVGICNPCGEDDAYNGLYLTKQEIATLVREKTLLQTPIKTEHAGAAIGSVVSAHVTDAGELQCVMELDEQHAAGAVVRGFIRDGLAPELSLGYVVDVTHSSNRLQAGAKRVLEISVVKKGAREGCYILGYEENGRTYTKAAWPASDWGRFCLGTPS